MAAYTWPGSLPQNVRRDFQLSRPVNIISTSMDMGPAKRRRRAAGIEQMKVGFYMTAAQIATLDTFVKSTLKGTARFDFAHPVTGLTVEVRIVPQQDGSMYTVAYYTPTLWTVDMAFEVLP
jgi:hypothetical protein